MTFTRCKEEVQPENIVHENNPNISLPKTTFNSFEIVPIEINEFEDDEVKLTLGTEEIVAIRNEGNIFLFIPTIPGEMELSIPSLNYRMQVTVNSTSLGGKTASEIFSELETQTALDSSFFNLPFSEEQNFILAQRSEVIDMFTNASAEQKARVANFIVANRNLINEWLEETETSSERRITTQYCQDKQRLNKLICLTGFFAKKLYIMGSGSFLAIALAPSGPGGILIGGIVGAFVIYPAFIAAKEIGYEMATTTGIILGKAGDEILDNGRSGDTTSIDIKNNKVLLDFEYSARRIEYKDSLGSDAVIASAVTSIIEFGNLWDKYIGNKLSNRPSLADPYSELVSIDGTMSFTTQLLNQTDYLSIKTVQVIDGQVEVEFNLLQEPGSDLEVSMHLSNEEIKREFLLNYEALPPPTIEIQSGNNQIGKQGEELVEPLKVLVTDDSENPISDVQVYFTVTSGAGTVSRESVVTDADGLVQVGWTLGNETNAQTVEAAIKDPKGGIIESVVFTATLSTPETIEIFEGNNQTGAPGEQLAVPLKVLVKDYLGDSFGNTPVYFTVSSGDGTVSDESVITTSDGYAQVNWTLGNNTDAQIVELSIKDREGNITAAVNFTATLFSCNDSEVDFEVLIDTYGTATINVLDNASIFEYSLSLLGEPYDWQNENVFYNISKDIYTVSIKDDDECIKSNTFELDPWLGYQLGYYNYTCSVEPYYIAEAYEDLDVYAGFRGTYDIEVLYNGNIVSIDNKDDFPIRSFRYDSLLIEMVESTTFNYTHRNDQETCEIPYTATITVDLENMRSLWQFSDGSNGSYPIILWYYDNWRTYRNCEGEIVTCRQLIGQLQLINNMPHIYFSPDGPFYPESWPCSDTCLRHEFSW